MYFGAKALFDDLEVEYVIPPFSSKGALELGAACSPEEICLPFKLMMGNYLEAIKQGADTILLTGSCGPCRFGEYCELQLRLLKKLGYQLEFIVIDSPADIGMKELLRRISKLSQNSGKSKYEKIKAVIDAIKVTNLIDEIEAKVHYNSGYEINRGDNRKLLANCKSEALKCSKSNEMITVLKKYKNKIDQISLDYRLRPVKVAIIGEIYTIMEPFSSLYIEEKLMDYGVSTTRKLTPSWWVKNTVFTSTNITKSEIREYAKEYLPFQVGGFAQECIGEAILAQREGFDGAIQILPMGCMPEIVSKSILPRLSADLNFPIMTLVVDEMTGEAGYITRIEAFIDLLERRRKNVLLRC